MNIHIVGTPRLMLFGMRSDEHLSRQLKAALAVRAEDDGRVLVARADVTATVITLGWLLDRRDVTLVDDAGNALLGVVGRSLVEPASGAVARQADPSGQTIRSGAPVAFARKLRRQEIVEALDLRRQPRVEVERRLFDLVYKGVTDIVTAHVWPTPAFHAVRALAAHGIKPNAVTLLGIALVLAAAACFSQGSWPLGLAAAWLMTFLDTVDGKLARVTGASSRLGDILDHGTDLIHPPLWWTCVAFGIAAGQGAESAREVGIACSVILATYALGRLCEVGFKRRFGFNAYLWKPFDSVLRSVIARRNVNLLFLSAGALAGQMLAAFTALAVWSVMSVGLQSVRFAQAVVAGRKGETVGNWLDLDAKPARVGRSPDRLIVRTVEVVPHRAA